MIWAPNNIASVRRTAGLANARRDALVLSILIVAVLLLIWNGSAFFNQISLGDEEFRGQVQLTSTALTLNVALILFGWRRYADLQHEAELRADGERREVIIATTDSLTGLLNRKGFADRAQQLAEQQRPLGEHIAMLSLQIHRYKAINDRHGFEIGDELLRRIAGAICEATGPDSIVARLSGDEFAVALALSAADLARAELIGEVALKAVTRPFEIDGKMIQVGAYSGIAAAPAGELRIPDLLRRADIAMDHAKNGRAARPVWFDSGMERALLAHSEIEQGIRVGLENGQFVPFFEPQVDLATGEVVGFEVLARWNHPLSGLIGPDVFIPVAEEIGLIGRLSEQVIHEALVQASQWDPALSISVNIAPSQLADGWLAQRIVRLLTETGFPSERLIVEITESSLFAELDLARSIVASLKNQGVRLALDDFGTGFSSLSHLRALPFDMIKIDRTFVSDLRSNRQNSAIIRAVSTLANALEVPVCIEGIEDEETRQSVIALGCIVGQGWYFGKAMTPDQAAQLLASRNLPPQPTTKPRSAAC
ncbi:MAG TPA: EAL domain-containing protein [Sphingomicrobium sp.]|nr:EAL domain-containing protein [Sphingomicrobium sp.]